MTQQLTRPPQEDVQPPIVPSKQRNKQRPRTGIVSFLVLIALLLVLFTGLLLNNVQQAINPAPTPTPEIEQMAVAPIRNVGPLQIPGRPNVAELQLMGERYVIYEQQNNVYMGSTFGGYPKAINTPGYKYNRAAPAVLLPSGKLLYSGEEGIWLTTLGEENVEQAAALDEKQVITSLVLSRDYKKIAWSIGSEDEGGQVKVYAGTLEEADLVYENTAKDCPCYRVFGFMDGGTGKSKNTTLLLTDNRGDRQAVQYGLWKLDLTRKGEQTPQIVLGGDVSQGPLALTAKNNTLLYSSYQGAVPLPTDGSVPNDIASLNYANSLQVASIGKKRISVDKAHVILPEQRELNNADEYRWVTTPVFSPDGRSLFYVEFSSDAETPYARHSALYRIPLSGAGEQLKVGKPQLLATTGARLMELGIWMDDRTLTFYADGSMYAVNTDSGAATRIAHMGAYSRMIAVVFPWTVASPD